MNQDLRARQDKALALYQRFAYLFVGLAVLNVVASLLALIVDTGALGFSYSFMAYLRNAMFEKTYGNGIGWNYAAYVISLVLVAALSLYIGFSGLKAKVKIAVWGPVLYLADSIYCFVIAAGASYPNLSATDAYIGVAIHCLGLIALGLAVWAYIRTYRLFNEGKKHA